MSQRAEILFEKLKNAKAIRNLVGQAEDGDFDCKEWHGAESAKASIAKAACGFANATGGVIIVGLGAKSNGQNQPDLVDGVKPVSDREAVKSAVLDIILKQVDPGIPGIRVNSVPDKPKSKSGFVVLYVPEFDGPPQRSRQDWRFYVRIASGTIPMEYFQIADRFGRRPHPKLEVIINEGELRCNMYPTPVRPIKLGLRNIGRGIARFPAVWFRGGQLDSQYSSIDGADFGLPLRPSGNDTVIFAGGADEVIYPGQELIIVELAQSGNIDNPKAQPGEILLRSAKNRYKFPVLQFTCSVACEGSPTTEVIRILNEAECYR